MTKSSPVGTQNHALTCHIPCFAPEKVAVIRERLELNDKHIAHFVRVFEALGNRTRLRIVLALEHEELCVCDVAHVLGLSMPATSHQLRALYDRGWLKMRNDGKMIYYRLDPGALREALQQGNIFLGNKVVA